MLQSFEGRRLRPERATGMVSQCRPGEDVEFGRVVQSQAVHIEGHNPN